MKVEAYENNSQFLLQRDVLRPAFLKCYNAFSALEKLSTYNSFYDNISNFDNFLIEYRSITSVLQKSLGSKDHPIYIKYRGQFLIGESCKWLKDSRNEVDHEHPFNLGKSLTIKVYTPSTATLVYTRDFDLENEKPFNSILQEIKDTLLSFHQLDVYFSCHFQFTENKKKIDIYPLVKEGVSKMRSFLEAIYNEIKPEDKITEELKGKVSKVAFDKLPEDMLFIHDYAYNVKKDSFTRGEIATICLSNERFPVKNLQKTSFGNNPFLHFMISHIMIYNMQKHELMPTFFILYKDNTCRITSCTFSVKTTLYRIINKIADEVIRENVKEVYIVSEQYVYPHSKINNFVEKTYEERVTDLNPKTVLSFYKLKDDMSTTSYIFDSSEIDKKEYVKKTLENKEHVSIENSFISPIYNAFKERLQ